MISSVYSYYLSQYGNKSNSKYDSHTRTQLKNTYSKVVKINSQTPVYKLDLSTAAQKYAIDLKEHARALENITEDLSDGADGTMTFKKSAVSSNASAVNASYITDFGAASDDESFDINVKQLACSQLNTGNYLQPRSKHIKPGEYSFDLSMMLYMSSSLKWTTPRQLIIYRTRLQDLSTAPTSDLQLISRKIV